MAITLALKPWMQWTLWGGLTLGLAGFLTWKMIKSEDKTVFLPGDTTHGHYQIELDCAACHEPFGGVRQESCVECHGQDLKDSDDSHPKKKFTDPRNADRIAVLDATQCVTCHVEHNPDITHKMGVTMPLDYCFRCHEDIADDRPSHTGLGFDTCATAVALLEADELMLQAIARQRFIDLDVRDGLALLLFDLVGHAIERFERRRVG